MKSKSEMRRHAISHPLRLAEHCWNLQELLNAAQAEIDRLRQHVDRLRNGVWDESDFAWQKLMRAGQTLPPRKDG